MEQKTASSPPIRLVALTLGALGIVYGDIGTSPLYALRECFHSLHGIPLGEGSIFGVLSLILWSILLVVTFKYLNFVMRADNRGEGGILALMALADNQSSHGLAGKLGWVIGLGLFGSSLLYGDAIITPAISVLSAVEGLQVVTPSLQPYVVGVAVFIISGIFLVQSRGTHRIGRFFGPVMLVWFLVLALLGIRGIRLAPQILAAMSPHHAFVFLQTYSWQGFAVLGSVFLAVTGGEALYADMGHFGRRPIQLGWYAVALPALVIHYFGQGALLLVRPEGIENPFYYLAPEWMLYPLVCLATAATVIASQAMLTGAFALSHQAIQLGYLPRFATVHTSPEERHQIYVPAINWFMFAGTLCLVVGFRTSSNLAAAYGIAVTGTMAITTLLTYVVAREKWNWHPAWALSVAGTFLVVDLAFLAANSLKIAHGGWLPLVLGGLIFFTMTTWKRGRALVGRRKLLVSTPIKDFLTQVCPKVEVRIPGVALFMTELQDMAPSAMVQNVRHNRVLHAVNVLLTVVTKEIPWVDSEARIQVTDLGDGFFKVVASYGFMESPNIPDLLKHCPFVGPPDQVTYFFSSDTVVATDIPGMALWREEIYVFLARNSKRTSFYFKVPSSQVIQLGEMVDI